MSHKIKFPILLAVMLTFFTVAGMSTISGYAEETGSKKEAEQKTVTQKKENNPYADAKITTTIIPSENKTFGYEILINGKILVHQPSIPGMPGNDGFTTKENAQKVADFVAKKIRNNEMPPTVTMDDLKSMDVLKKDKCEKDALTVNDVIQ